MSSKGITKAHSAALMVLQAGKAVNGTNLIRCKLTRTPWAQSTAPTRSHSSGRGGGDHGCLALACASWPIGWIDAQGVPEWAKLPFSTK